LDKNGNGVFAINEAFIAGGLRQSLTLAKEFAHLQPRVLPPDVLTIKEPGPVRAVVRIAGWIDDGLTNRLVRYDLRVHAVVGWASIKAEHTATQLSDRIKTLLACAPCRCC
jgi:hypothetical protein